MHFSANQMNLSGHIFTCSRCQGGPLSPLLTKMLDGNIISVVCYVPVSEKCLVLILEIDCLMIAVSLVHDHQ